jgi:ATP-binding protein involved in chromosome partitioning
VEAGTDTSSQSDILDDVLREHMQGIGMKLLVLSGKGGVGKSTIAANLAVALAREGSKVGLLDADLHGPSIPVLLGLGGKYATMEGNRIQPVEVMGNLKVISIGLLLRHESEAVIWRGPLKFSAIRQLLRDVDWGELDWLVVDSPPGTGDEPLSVAQLVGTPAGAIIVTTPQNVAVSDVRRCVTFCSRLSLNVIGILENMSGMVCPHCGKEITLFSRGGGEALAREMNVPYLGTIPLDPGVVVSGDRGTPFAGSASDGPAAEHFERFVRAVLDRTEKLRGVGGTSNGLERST